jgi:hypothetical protein
VRQPTAEALVAVTIGLPHLNRLGIRDWATGVSPWASHLTASAPIGRFGSTTESSLGLQFDNKENARLNAFLPGLNRHGRGRR